MLEECKAGFTEKNFDFLLSEEASLIFCGWLLEGGLQVGTFESYFADLRAFHLANGFSCISLRTPLINQVINGRKHQPKTKEKKGNRMPATPAVLKVIRENLKSLNRGKKDKFLIWTVCTAAFAGAFRAGELLCKYSSHFNPNVNLMRQDVREKTVTVDGKNIAILQIKLKSEKTGRPNSCNWVDVSSVQSGPTENSPKMVCNQFGYLIVLNLYWIRIRIHQTLCIQIRIRSMRINNQHHWYIGTWPDWIHSRSLRAHILFGQFIPCY